MSADALARRLRRETRGEVLFDAASRGRYATDASIYQIVPVGVFVPTTPDDVATALAVARELKVPVLAHAGPHFHDMQLATERALADGDTVTVGDHTLRAIATPGHLPDMLCFAVEGEPHIVVGDTIFEGGPGRTWSAEDFKTTLRVLRAGTVAALAAGWDVQLDGQPLAHCHQR